jgi:hypothetical protein
MFDFVNPRGVLRRAFGRNLPKGNELQLAAAFKVKAARQGSYVNKVSKVQFASNIPEEEREIYKNTLWMFGQQAWGHIQGQEQPWTLSQQDIHIVQIKKPFLLWGRLWGYEFVCGLEFQMGLITHAYIAAAHTQPT